MHAHRFSGEVLRARRHAAGIKPELLAVKVDRSLPSLFHYEQNRTDPPASIVAALADALGCHPGDLFTEAEL
jgi:transcriptional regulator with XRE-family HTH domain